MHDVDLLPFNDELLYEYPSDAGPLHIAYSSSSWSLEDVRIRGQGLRVARPKDTTTSKNYAFRRALKLLGILRMRHKRNTAQKALGEHNCNIATDLLLPFTETHSQ
uniref:Uncharacterized protein n=1 Tax=Glossina pallidipes TaxID=7398 RepID=A0A1B0A492_GLOPL